MPDGINQQGSVPSPKPVTPAGGPQPTKRKSRFKLKFSQLLFLAVLVLLGLFAWTEYNRRTTAKQLEATTSQLEQLRQSTSESNDAQAAAVLNKVRALMDIPANPVPTVATISDVDRLREANEFFSVAQNGDYLILTAKRAILYDEDRNVILDVAPFSVAQNTPATNTPAPTPSPTEAE